MRKRSQCWLSHGIDRRLFGDFVSPAAPARDPTKTISPQINPDQHGRESRREGLVRISVLAAAAGWTAGFLAISFRVEAG